MLFSYAHGMYLPYTNAVHCYKIDQLMIKGSKAVVDTINRLRNIADIWVSMGLKKPWSFPDPSTLGDERQILAWLVKDPHLLPQIYRAIGQVELTAAFCQSKTLVPVDWSESVVPMCKMVDAVDPLLEESKRVPFTLIMSKGQHHAICTGPNRGGKSTFLRSALTNLVLAHTWGVAFAGQCKMTPVEWIISSLRLEDRPGQASLFEREVTVAGDIVKLIRANKTRGWVIIDELFHTTNPPDAATASQIFLRQLWSSGMVTSIVSTHLFSHAEGAPAQVQRLCVDSGMDEATGQIVYKYQVTPGINTMSSVRELLVESGVVA
jgi:DNA mismatch repair ATPase MutS